MRLEHLGIIERAHPRIRSPPRPRSCPKNCASVPPPPVSLDMNPAVSTKTISAYLICAVGCSLCMRCSLSSMTFVTPRCTSVLCVKNAPVGSVCPVSRLNIVVLPDWETRQVRISNQCLPVFLKPILPSPSACGPARFSPSPAVRRLARRNPIRFRDRDDLLHVLVYPVGDHAPRRRASREYRGSIC